MVPGLAAEFVAADLLGAKELPQALFGTGWLIAQ
jgi:hypothetical protein